MSALLEAPLFPRARKAVRWTRDDCAAFEKIGVLPARWELVEGDIIDKMGINWPHARVTKRGDSLLSALFTGDCVLAACSIDVAPEDNPTSQPEPDLIVLNRPVEVIGHNPQPRDIVLLAEVADTTLEFDLGPKAHLYARAGIAEYLVFDLKNKRIHQHRDPTPAGYATIHIAEAGGVIALLSRPDATIAVDTLFDKI